MKKNRTYEEINEKIKSGKACVLTADEVSKLSTHLSSEEIFEKVDVVTTATFSPMCSSGLFINFGNTNPPIRIQKAFINNVPVFCGLAAVDAYIGATTLSISEKKYGGAFVIESLAKGEDVFLRAYSDGTDCYPSKFVETYINKETVNEMILFNPRNVYQNYPAATNGSGKKIYTYMGMLLPEYGNVKYATSGELSPLINDPELKTIGIGTKIFLASAKGYIAFNGTQYNTDIRKNDKGIPIGGARTLSLVGNFKQMNPEYLKAVYIKGYGVSLYVGVGIAIPILDIDMAKRVSIKNKDIYTKVCDYSIPSKPVVTIVNYEQLFSGKIVLNGKEVKTSTVSSLSKAKKISNELKKWIENGKFLLSQPVESLPVDQKMKKLKIRNRKKTTIRKISEIKESKKIYFNQSDCINCGSCISTCSSNALFFDKNRILKFNPDLCTGCFNCVDSCFLNLFVKKEEEKVSIKFE